MEVFSKVESLYKASFDEKNLEAGDVEATMSEAVGNAPDLLDFNFA